MKQLKAFFLFILSATSLPLLAAEKPPAVSLSNPNILFFFADDQRNHTLGCAGHPIVKTPNIDRLAAEGVRFENAFVSTSTCWVSRACLFTGCYERRHLYQYSGDSKILNPDLCATSYFAVLKKAGYRTGHIGKEHVNLAKESADVMFDVRRKLHRNPYHKKQDDGSTRHATQILGDWGIEFLSEQPKDQPFCLTVSFNATHAEDGDKRPGVGHYPWPKVMDGHYDEQPMPLPPLNDPAMKDIPPLIRRQPRKKPTATSPDVTAIPVDLTLPEVVEGEPASGKRVLQALPGYRDSTVRHALYLPTDWVKGKSYPVIVEYTGNNGTVAGGRACQGYGISGGKGYLWVTLPFVSQDGKVDMDWWWGDPDRTADYAKAAIESICSQWGGNSKAVMLTGYSRGAIACNYIGLRDNEIAKLWLGMVPASHYDNRPWKQSAAEQRRNVERLRRLGKTPQYVCGEHHLAKNHHDRKLLAMVQAGSFDSIETALRELDLQSMLDQENIRSFIMKNHPDGDFTFDTFPWVNHDGQWILRDTPTRRKLRTWVRKLVAKSN